MDANPEYDTDRGKEFLAELITLGRADAHEMHITWDDRCIVRLDQDGNPVSIEGWPGESDG